MIKVLLPNNFLPERKYIAETIMSDLLGVDFTIQTDETTKDYTIELQNGNLLIFRDAFFSNHNEDEGYLKHSSLPAQVFFTKNDFLAEDNIPVIYGSDFLEVSESNIICGIDIFASAFFMLTRWEEYVVTERDNHNRFPGEAALSYKSDFLLRPAVNEYIEMLWNMLVYLGYPEEERKITEYKLYPTHDVDRVFFNYQFKKYFGDIFVDKKPSNALKRLYFDLTRQNVFDTFDWIMSLSEKQNLQSRFYFMSNGRAVLDNKYKLNDVFVRNKISEIISRGHIIGFHPGYNTYSNEEEWRRQKEFLQNNIGLEVSEGRQHYLRLNIPETFRIMNNNNMLYDSSMTYPDEAGFRCGTGNEFFLFDFLERKKMKLKEKPLIFMEGSLRERENPEKSLQLAVESFHKLREESKKYKMPFTILFHNNSFEPLRWKGWKEFYENDVMS